MAVLVTSSQGKRMPWWKRIFPVCLPTEYQADSPLQVTRENQVNCAGAVSSGLWYLHSVAGAFTRLSSGVSSGVSSPQVLTLRVGDFWLLLPLFLNILSSIGLKGMPPVLVTCLTAARGKEAFLWAHSLKDTVRRHGEGVVAGGRSGQMARKKRFDKS